MRLPISTSSSSRARISESRLQPLRHVQLLEQPLLLLGLDAQRSGDHVRQLRRVVDVRDRQLELLGQVRELLDDAREGGLDVALEPLELRRRHELVGQLRDARDEVGLRGHEVPELHALAALHEDADRAVGHLHHPRDDADDAHPVELVRAGRLRLRVLRGDHDEHPVAAEHVVHELHRALLADRERHHRLREGDAVAQRQHGQRLGQPRLDGDLRRLAVHGWHVDRHWSAIGTRRTDVSGAASGISTWSTPSAYDALAWSATTSAPSSTTLRNGPCSISICW